MSDKSTKISTIPEPAGENPPLSEDEIAALRSRPDNALVPPEGSPVGDIQALTEQLLGQNILGGVVSDVAISEHDDATAESQAPRSSMTPERLRTTNRPPDDNILREAALALRPKQDKGASSEDPDPDKEEDDKTAANTIFCVEQDK